MKRSWTIPLVSLLLTSCDSPPLDVTASAGPECGIALVYVQHILVKKRRERLVFTEENERLCDEISWEGWQGSKEPKTGPPPAEILAELAQSHGASAIKLCPLVRAFLKTRQIGFGTAEIFISRLSGLVGFPNSTVVGVSLPAVAQDGNEAVLASSAISGPWNAGGYLDHLKRHPRGQWRSVGTKGLWAS